jgi:hypothetical protein
MSTSPCERLAKKFSPPKASIRPATLAAAGAVRPA